MRFQYASLKSKPPLFQPLNPCPVCGAETTLAESEPHPLHAKFEIHGYLCDRCGPIKSVVVLRGPPLQPLHQQQQREPECDKIAIMRSHFDIYQRH